MEDSSIICRNERDTAQVAAALAPLLHPGDAIILIGDLAAGKTRFVQALVAALGSDAAVTSPTFTLAQFYPTPAGTVLHIDAYRLTSVAEFRDLGLTDFTPDAITAIEWGEKVASDFTNALSIHFDFITGSDTSRKLTFDASAPRWQPLIRQLCESVQA